jgi:hypothetical protein
MAAAYSAASLWRYPEIARSFGSVVAIQHTASGAFAIGLQRITH